MTGDPELRTPEVERASPRWPQPSAGARARCTARSARSSRRATRSPRAATSATSSGRGRAQGLARRRAARARAPPRGGAGDPRPHALAERDQRDAAQTSARPTPSWSTAPISSSTTSSPASSSWRERGGRERRPRRRLPHRHARALLGLLAPAAAAARSRWFFRMRVYGAEHVPRTGPAVIASNHIAGIDVVVLGSRVAAHDALHGQDRAVHVPVPSPGCCATPAPSPCAAASPTSRRCAWRAASCAQGKLLGVFFEGTRQPSEEIGAVRPARR